jgi:hypothetical protein
MYVCMVYVTTLISSSYNMASNNCMIVDYEFEGIWKEAVWPHLRCNFGFGPGCLRIVTKNLSQDIGHQTETRTGHLQNSS